MKAMGMGSYNMIEKGAKGKKMKAKGKAKSKMAMKKMGKKK